jgi:hypothetical protein
LISFAADAARWDRARTSEATTAKPRPCSPALAASTAAFSASRLVWNEISSITRVISVARRELSSIRPIVRASSIIPAAASVALCVAAAARLVALRQLWAFWPMVAVSSSMPAAEVSSVAACSSVRLARSAVSPEALVAACAIASALARTWLTMSSRFCFMRSMPASRGARSPPFAARRPARWLRSPLAILSMLLCMRPTLRRIATGIADSV